MTNPAASPAPTPPAAVDCSAPPDDLMLQFEVRVWSRNREVFKQQRIVNVWKGALEPDTYRFLAGKEIIAQLEHLLECLRVELKSYTAEVEKPPPAKWPLFGLTLDFEEEAHTAKMPLDD